MHAKKHKYVEEVHVWFASGLHNVQIDVCRICANYRNNSITTGGNAVHRPRILVRLCDCVTLNTRH